MEYHVKASTPEELRQEVVQWAKGRAESLNYMIQLTNPNLRAKIGHLEIERNTYRAMQYLWSEVIIDPTEPTTTK